MCVYFVCLLFQFAVQNTKATRTTGESQEETLVESEPGSDLQHLHSADSSSASPAEAGSNTQKQLRLPAEEQPDAHTRLDVASGALQEVARG